MNVGELKVPENNFLQYIEMPTKLLTKFIFKLKVMFKSLQFMHLNQINVMLSFSFAIKNKSFYVKQIMDFFIFTTLQLSRGYY